MDSNDVFKRVLHFCGGCEKVYLYGKGNLGKLTLKFLEDNGIRVAGFVVTKKREGSDEIRNSSGKVIPVYEKEEFLSWKQAGGIIFSLSEQYQAQLDREEFRLWKSLWLKDYQLNELSRYEFVKRTGKSRWISPVRTSAEKWTERVFEEAKKRKYAAFGTQIDPWHMIPKYKKPYIKDIISTACGLLSDADENVVECGCGLCDILGNKKLKQFKRFGFDVDKNVILVDREMYPDIDFTEGSFEKIQHMSISVLIAVNFPHMLPVGVLHAAIHNLLAENQVRYFIVDEATGLYKYAHKFAEILPPEYTEIKAMGPYEGWGGVRYIKVFALSGQGKS